MALHTPTTNWAGNVTYNAATVLAPESLAEVCNAVQSAPQITVLGSRHSFNTIADTSDTQLTLTRMPPQVEIDSARREVKVAAGMTYAQVAAELNRNGWALQNMASLPHISIAGAIATGTHGSGVGNPSLAQAVTALDIVRADGSVDYVDDGEMLDAHRVALGALGVITAVTLQIEPQFEVTQTVSTGLNWDAVDTHFEAIMSAGYSVSMFTRYGPEGVLQVWTKRRTDRPYDTVDLNAFGAAPAQMPIHPVPGSDTSAVTEQGGMPGPWHERLPHFRSDFEPSAGAEIQSEYLLPAHHAVAAIHALRAFADDFNPVLFISEIRRVAADTGWLSPNHGIDAVGLHLTFHRDADAVNRLLPRIDDALAPFGARPHWGKVFATTPERLYQAYPQLTEFSMLADELDPHRRFRNQFLDLAFERPER